MSSNFLTKDLIYVNSRNRVAGSSNDFIIDLSKQIPSFNNNYDSISLLSFYCSKSYYLFNSNNNTFILIENGISKTVTIPIGNYNISTLVIQIIVSLNSVASYVYNATFSFLNGKLTFTVTGNGGIQPIFNFTSDNRCEEILGFDIDNYSFAGNSLMGAYIVNLQLTNTIQLLSNLVNNDILSIIIPNSSDFSNIQYNEQSPEFASRKLISNKLNSCHFWLLDEAGDNLDLNGIEFSFSFAIFKSNSYYIDRLVNNKIDNYIKNIND
jgi:hypothetical protein